MKKLLLLVLMLSTLRVTTMEPNAKDIPYVTTGMEEGKKQLELINALEVGDKARISQLLDAGMDINKPFGLFGFKGYTPLTLMVVGKFSPYKQTLKANREEIARFLISKGATIADLNEYLLPAVRRGQIKEVKLLLALGAKDTDGAALKFATDEHKEYVSSSFYASEIEKVDQIIKLLEAKKSGPLRLAPLVKPAAAQPVAKPAAQPVRLVPTVRPAAAQPK